MFALPCPKHTFSFSTQHSFMLEHTFIIQKNKGVTIRCITGKGSGSEVDKTNTSPTTSRNFRCRSIILTITEAIPFRRCHVRIR